MRIPNMKQQSVNVHSFAMVPKAEIPRSAFPIQHNLKTTFSFAQLIPILCEEVLPGDHWNCRLTIVARTAIPIVPIMDNWHLETFAFFVPNRLVWTNWVKFMGEQNAPGDSISFTIPQVVSPVGGFVANEIFDHFGLPCVGQVNGAMAVSVNALPLRAYNLIMNQWFRDENLTNPLTVFTGDGPDAVGTYGIQRRSKAPDYFTKALPWPQKGNTAVPLPLGTTAPIKSLGMAINFANTANDRNALLNLTSGTNAPTWTNAAVAATSGANFGPAGTTITWANVDLSLATAATINQLRQSFQIQKLLERDARGGTRYTEIVRAHFGVVSPDARLQRPEYIGGGKTNIETSAIPQTSATGLTGGSTPAGTLAATGHAQGTHGFNYAATEHGYIIVLANARADLTYMQGMRRMWTRSTRYDFYFPVFAMLGEQAVYNYEIFSDGTVASGNVFGYQERWAEYRYLPSRINGLFRATTTGNIAYWHTAELFAAAPALNDTFIKDQSHIVTQRNFSAGALSVNQQILADILFTGKMARPLPVYSVPGMIDHF